MISKIVLMNKLLFLVLFSNIVFSQNLVINDSIPKTKKIKLTSFIAPAACITYGLISLESHSLSALNSNVKEEVKEHIDKKITIDDFSQYAPAVSVYALNGFGIKGKNNFKDRTILLTTSFALMASSVTIIKNTGSVIRPDGSSNNSFPSGHTATAFMGATYLWEEYKDVSIWYGISGYVIATGTGIFRVVNNRHWVSDIAMGAGIGILSTKIAYWLVPLIKDKIFKKSDSNLNSHAILIMPTYDGKKVGIGLNITL